jgi:diaminopimelate decarboxylase
MLNDSIQYQSGILCCDSVALKDILIQTGTPVYIYSLKRALSNLERIRQAFAAVHPHIHYSAKANANLAVLGALVQAGAGVDAVSAGEIHRAFLAGADPADIVFAGVGKTPNELGYALEHGVGWINVENVGELQIINDIVAGLGRAPARVALRLNPDVSANTHHHIATGHGTAKFGLSAEVVRGVLKQQADYPHIRFDGLHIHIGSQLHDSRATRQAVQLARELMAPYPDIRTLNIGGGLPVAYSPDETIPDWNDFASDLLSLLEGCEVILEPGRSIIADAGLLATSVLYRKQQNEHTLLITDSSMAELIRPALYEAHHEIVPLFQPTEKDSLSYEIVGPVCESSDVLGHNVSLPDDLRAGDVLAILTAGAYGMAMASNYNQRVRPPEVVVSEDGKSWFIARRRETWDDLLRTEL